MRDIVFLCLLASNAKPGVHHPPGDLSSTAAIDTAAAAFRRDASALGNRGAPPRYYAPPTVYYGHGHWGITATRVGGMIEIGESTMTEATIEADSGAPFRYYAAATLPTFSCA
jgi:hypothetical protein